MAAPNQIRETNIEGKRYIEIGAGNWFAFDSGTVGAAVSANSQHAIKLRDMRTR